MNIESENKWAFYPIEKIEAAMACLNEAIVMARAAQREAEARKQQVRAELAHKFDEKELNKLLCPGCRDCMVRFGEIEPVHIYADGSCIEACTATPERKQQIREFFKKEFQK